MGSEPVEETSSRRVTERSPTGIVIVPLASPLALFEVAVHVARISAPSTTSVAKTPSAWSLPLVSEEWGSLADGVFLYVE